MNTRELFDLSGRAAIVTGGATGIGRQMAQGLAEMGANLVICARNLERCRQAAGELAALGVKTLAMRCDVRSPEEIQSVVDAALAAFGRIDILVNNAGVAWGSPAEEMAPADWAKVIETNLTGTFLCSQAVGRVMIEQKRGKIINVASVAGLHGTPPEIVQIIGYSASKGGVIALTRDLACEWARYNINVNAIAPGWFPSEMTHWVLEHRGDLILTRVPLGRFGGEDDLKGAAVFLASDASNYVTGHVLVVDGGITA